MANFNTHLNIATINSGLAAAALLSTNHIDFNSAMWLWFLGTIGGLLPDIDSDNSTSLDTIYGLLTLSVTLLSARYASETFFNQIRFIELVAITIVIYLTMRYVIRPLFEKLTVHRGSCHSILFLLLSALLTTQVTWQLNDEQTRQAEIMAWLSGGFVFLGGLTHLLLDEIYSVDLRNVRIKRSFGTAIKLADFKNKSLTLLIILAVAGLFYIAPSPENTINVLTDWSAFRL